MTTPYSVVWVGVTGSTQDDARESSVGRPLLVVADCQTGGRGRRGSAWETAPRAAAMSFAFDLTWPSETWSILPLVAAVAAAKAFDVDVKWPNDLLIGDAKVGGILVEATDGVAVVGIGLNLWWPDPPTGYGALLKDDPGVGHTEGIARRWADELWSNLSGGPSEWPRSEYRSRCVTIGRSITWEPDGRGQAVEVAGDGALEVVSATGERLSLRSGAIHHVRNAGARQGSDGYPSSSTDAAGRVPRKKSAILTIASSAEASS